MQKLMIGPVVLLLLAACSGTITSGGNVDGNEVCNQQAAWAQSGKVDGGNIIITCPGHARYTN